MAGIKSNQSIKVEVETTGLGLTGENKYPDTTGTWLELCPETINYNLDIATSERNPLCKAGKVAIPTSKTLTVAAEGYLDEDNAGEKWLFKNFLNLDNFLIRITDSAFDKANPQVYVGDFSRTALAFPATGGDVRTFSLEGSAGEYIEE